MVDNIHKKAAFCVVPYWGQGLPGLRGQEIPAKAMFIAIKGFAVG